MSCVSQQASNPQVVGHGILGASMIHTVSSRNALSALGAAGFLGAALVCGLVRESAWLIWAGAVFMLIGAGLAWRLLLPIEARLETDAQGIRWWQGTRQLGDVRWREMRALRQSLDDDSFRIDVGRPLEVHIPTQFLRTPATHDEFLQAVAMHRPDLEVERR